MTVEQAKSSPVVPPGVYFEGAVWGAAGALVLVGLLEGWPVASAVGLAGVSFQAARFLRWLARVSPPDAEPGAAADGGAR